MTREIMIVAGEASGDLHGSRLVAEIKKKAPEFSFCGMGGQELYAQQVELLFDAAKIAVVGLFEVASHVIDIIKAQKTLRQRLVTNRPELLILIDFPDFNLLLARKAKQLGLPVFYYISPQVWAWRSGRVRTISRLVDKIGVILPFEEDFYRQRGVDAVYVGHPLLDSVRSRMSREQFCAAYEISPQKKIVGLLPGSRIKELSTLLPVFMEAAHLLHSRCQNQIVFMIPKAPTISEKDILENSVERYRDCLDIRIISNNRYEMMSACDAVITASGTVTLELLLLDTVMVVAYRLSRNTYKIARLLVDIDFFSLVNLVAGCEVVPELLQDQVNPETIANRLYELLHSERVIGEMKEQFIQVRKKLGEEGASERAAELALSLVKKQ